MVGDILAWAGRTDDDQVAVLLDQAGMGKSAVLRDVLSELEGAGVDVLAIKADLQLEDVTEDDDMTQALRLPDSVYRVVARLAALSPVVVLIDQIDALSLSLAHDQKALNVILDLVARLRTIAGVHILLSCRTFDFNTDPRFQNRDPEALSVGRAY